MWGFLIASQNCWGSGSLPVKERGLESVKHQSYRLLWDNYYIIVKAEPILIVWPFFSLPRSSDNFLTTYIPLSVSSHLPSSTTPCKHEEATSLTAQLGTRGGLTQLWGDALHTVNLPPGLGNPCLPPGVCVHSCVPPEHRERIQWYFTQMRNVILQIKASPSLVLSLFMLFHFPLRWHGCPRQGAPKDVIGVVKDCWAARTLPHRATPLLSPICHHLMWQSFYRALRHRRLKVNTAIRRQLGRKCSAFHSKLHGSSG